MAYIYDRLSTSDITRALHNDDNASWSKNWAACEALAEYLEEYAESCDTPMELDIVAIRCDFSMYSDIAELNKEYDEEFESMDDLNDYAQIIKVDDESFITDFSGR